MNRPANALWNLLLALCLAYAAWDHWPRHPWLVGAAVACVAAAAWDVWKWRKEP